MQMDIYPNITMNYGLEFDRDYFVDILFRINSILPILASITIYPMNFYLLIVQGSAMSRDIRAAYIVNLVSLIFCDWIFTFLIRFYAFPPYGLFYCEGILCSAELTKHIVKVIPPTAILCDITTFYVLMLRLHQLTVTDFRSPWKLSLKSQLLIYVILSVVCVLNIAGFVRFTSKVENYEELVKTPDLAWLEQRGGILLLFSEPGKGSEFIFEMFIFLASAGFFLPLLLLFIFHALIYLRKNEQNARSTKTQIVTHRLFVTFSLQILGAIIFFICPIGVILTTIFIDLSDIISGEAFAAIRFVCIMLFELHSAQSVLVFVIRNAQLLRCGKGSVSSRRSSDLKLIGQVKGTPVVTRFRKGSLP